MIFVEEKEVKVQVEKNEVKVEKIEDKIYINTLIPEFEFKNGRGQIVRPSRCCAEL